MKRNQKLKRLGAAIRGVREQVGLTQIGLAEKIGVKQNTVSRIETGEADFPVSHLWAIAKACGVTVSELTEGL